MEAVHKAATIQERIESDGFAIAQSVFGEEELAVLMEKLGHAALPRSRAGLRHAMRIPAVALVARGAALLGIAREILGDGAFPFRATLFDKSTTANWLVVWHQDTALPLRERCETPGWGPWSVKDGVQYAHAPANALEQVVALRVHLDDSTSENGPLRVLPGTHSLGVLTDDEIHDLSRRVAEAECLVPRGGVLPSSLQKSPFVFNDLQVAPPATSFFSSFCIVAGGYGGTPRFCSPS